MNALTQDRECAGMMEVRMPILLTAPTLPVWAVGRLKFAGAKAGTLPKQRRDDLDSFPTKVIFLLLS